jgi:aminopeptidase N
VKVDYVYDDAAGKATVIIEQTQKTDKVFTLPIAVDVYTGTTIKRHMVWAKNRIDSFSFSYTQKPDLINVDADKIMLWAKTDNKTIENFVHQYKNAPLYLDRREALDFFAKKNMMELAQGLKDKYAPLREFTIVKLMQSKFAKDAAVIKQVEELAAKEKNKRAKAAALDFLTATGDTKYLSLFKANVTDSSYSVAGAALYGLSELDPGNAYALAKKYSTDAKGDLGKAVSDVIMVQGTENDFDFIADRFDKMPLSQAKFESLNGFCDYLTKLNNIDKVKKGVDMVIKFRNAIPEQFRNFTDGPIKAALGKVAKAKGTVIEEAIEKGLK